MAIYFCTKTGFAQRFFKRLKFLSLFWLLFFGFPYQACAVEPGHDQNLAHELLKSFFSMKAATGDFVQIGPKGQRSQGKFYLKRPGKMRFYYKDSPLEIVSDGQSVAVHNKSLNSWSVYQLDQTPLKFILADRLTKTFDPISQVERFGDLLALTLEDKKMRGMKLKLFFDIKSKMLTRWTTIDAQNLATQIFLSHLQKNVTFEKKMFEIPYQDIAMQKQKR